MIPIYKSPNADSRTAVTGVTKDQLLIGTKSHQSDVQRGMELVASMIAKRGAIHDHTKNEHLDEYHAAIRSGKVKETEWYNFHVTKERHHLKSHVPNDVNLIDVMEHIVDCTMAGLARSGQIYDTDISPDVLVLACQNTVELLKKNIIVVDGEKKREHFGILDQNMED